MRTSALQFFRRPPGSQFEILFATLGCGQALSNLLLSLLDRPHERRPDELDRESDEDRKSDRLGDHGYTDVHGCLLNGS